MLGHSSTNILTMYTFKALSTYNVTIHIHLVLNKMCLMGITRDDSTKKIVKTKNKIQIILMLTVMTIVSVGCITFRYLFFYKITDVFVPKRLIELCLHLVTTFQAFRNIISYYNCDVSVDRTFYSNYGKLDFFLEMDNNIYYNNLNKTVNWIFFVTIAVVVSRTILSLVISSVTNTLLPFVMFLNFELLMAMQITYLAYLLVELFILRNKMVKFAVVLSRELSTKGTAWRTTRNNDLMSNVDIFSRCYQMFHEQLFIMSKKHGCQV